MDRKLAAKIAQGLNTQGRTPNSKPDRACKSFEPNVGETGPDADCIHCGNPRWYHGVDGGQDKQQQAAPPSND